MSKDEQVNQALEKHQFEDIGIAETEGYKGIWIKKKIFATLIIEIVFILFELFVYFTRNSSGHKISPNILLVSTPILGVGFIFYLLFDIHKLKSCCLKRCLAYVIEYSGLQKNAKSYFMSSHIKYMENNEIISTSVGRDLVIGRIKNGMFVTIVFNKVTETYLFLSDCSWVPPEDINF